MGRRGGWGGVEEEEKVDGRGRELPTCGCNGLRWCDVGEEEEKADGSGSARPTSGPRDSVGRGVGMLGFLAA